MIIIIIIIMMLMVIVMIKMMIMMIIMTMTSTMIMTMTMTVKELWTIMDVGEGSTFEIFLNTVQDSATFVVILRRTS